MDTAKIAVISCSHSPFTPEDTREWLLSTLANIKGLTHFGHLGDVFDATSASVHPNEAQHTLEDEYRHASEFLRDIRAVLPRDCNLWVNNGNHDDNLMAKDPRRIPQDLRGLVHWSRHPEFCHEFRKWEWLPYTKSREGIKRIGQCLFFHGFDAGASSDELEGLQAVNMTDAPKWSLTVRGHTHRPVAPKQARRTAKIPLPWYHMNVGTCGPLNPDWAKRQDTSQWGAAVGVVETLVASPSKLNGKCWNAELLRMP